MTAPTDWASDLSIWEDVREHRLGLVDGGAALVRPSAPPASNTCTSSPERARQSAILDLLRSAGHARPDEIVAALGCSSGTARASVALLKAAGLVRACPRLSRGARPYYELSDVPCREAK